MIGLKNSNLKRIVDYVHSYDERVPYDATVAITLAQLSLIPLLYRIKARSFNGETISNIYVGNFMPSGTGKDLTIRVVNSLMASYFERKSKMEERYCESITSKALEELPEDATDRLKEKTINEAKPRSLIDIFSNATVEGFIATREEMERAGFGGTLVTISEFSDYILKDSVSKDEFLSMMKEVYEEGDNYAKVIKMERTSKGIKGVPSSFLYQSTPTGLLSGKGTQRMIDFLNSGIGRRSLLCFPTLPNVDKTDVSFEEEMRRQQELQQQKGAIKDIIKTAVLSNKLNKIYTYTPEANRMLFDYSKQTKYSDISGVEEAIAADRRSRARRVHKLSGIIASIESPKDEFINTDHVSQSILIIEHFAMYLERFIAALFEDEIIKLSNFFLENKNKVLKTMDIRNQRFVGSNRFTYWIEEAVEEAKNYLYAKGYELIVTTKGRGTEYLLLKRQ